MNDLTFRSASLAALFVVGALATGCAFDPDAPSTDNEADESESVGTTQQAAIVFRGGTGQLPGCGSRQEGQDGLCYARCKEGYWGEVTRCRELCGAPYGACSVPEKAYDRGAGVPKSCALLGLGAGQDGKCYGLTSTSGPIKTPATGSAPAAPAETPVGADATKCGHTFDRNGQPMMWSNGRCITQAQYQAANPMPKPAAPTGETICPYVDGCGWKPPTGVYSSTYSSTNHVKATGHDLLGYE